jgi:hypothetical protein
MLPEAAPLPGTRSSILRDISLGIGGYGSGNGGLLVAEADM